MELEFIPPAEKDGKKVVLVSEEDVSEEVKRLKSTLIGYVLGYANEYPSFNAMDSFIDVHWRKNENVQVKLHSLYPGIFAFDCQTSESKQLILERGPWTFQENPLVLRPWAPDLRLEAEELLRSVFTWIKLPHLKLHFWSPRMISKIASMVGRPLLTDKLTAAKEKLSYARVFVEIYADEEQPDLVRIEDEEGSIYYQDVDYEWCPPKCNGCEIFGHCDVECPYAKFFSSVSLH